jgi:hypothetical protein
VSGTSVDGDEARGVFRVPSFNARRRPPFGGAVARRDPTCHTNDSQAKSK